MLVLTIFPLPGGRVDVAKQLKSGDGFGIEVNPHGLAAHDGICLVERAKNFALSCRMIPTNLLELATVCVSTCSSIANDKHRMADVKKLFKLDYFQNKQLLWLQPLCLDKERECV